MSSYAGRRPGATGERSRPPDNGVDRENEGASRGHRRGPNWPRPIRARCGAPICVPPWPRCDHGPTGLGASIVDEFLSALPAEIECPVTPAQNAMGGGYSLREAHDAGGFHCCSGSVGSHAGCRAGVHRPEHHEYVNPPKPMGSIEFLDEAGVERWRVRLSGEDAYLRISGSTCTFMGEVYKGMITPLYDNVTFKTASGKEYSRRHDGVRCRRDPAPR